MLCKINDSKVYDAAAESGIGCGNGLVFSQVDICPHRMRVAPSRRNFTLKEVIYYMYEPLDLIKEKCSRKKKKSVVPPIKNFLDEYSVLF